MKTIIFIPSTENTPTVVCKLNGSSKYTLLKQPSIKVRGVYYHAFVTDTEHKIFRMDWCIVTNPYDGEEYCEQCKKIASENSRDIFYGIDGTRCLLIDAVKIIGTTNILLKEIEQIIVTEEILQEFNNKHLSFMEEDLLE